MQLDELKKSMSTLEQVLAKTNTEITIDVSAATTAQNKLFRTYLKAFISLIILAAIFTAATIANVNVESFPNSMKLYLVALLTVSAVWYGYMSLRVKRISIPTLSPAALFSHTAKLRLLFMAGEVFLTVGIAVFFSLTLQYAWSFNRLGFWLVVIAIPVAVAFELLHICPSYIRLFRELNSINK